MRDIHCAALLCICIVVALTAPAWADDLVSPPWPRGAEGTTYQAWEFDTPANPADPDVVDNPYGLPFAQAFGALELPLLDTWWLEEDNGHEGVWNVGGSLGLYIPNRPMQDDRKEIWLQITCDAGCGALPHVLSVPDYATISLVGQIDAGGGYTHDTYHIVIKPNPDDEWLYILPRYGQAYIDEIVVDTICIPEPVSILILAPGLWILSRRRASRK
jgi:hypothetical protein